MWSGSPLSDLARRPGTTHPRKAVLAPVASQRNRYLSECDSHKKIPMPLPFVTGPACSGSAAYEV